MPSNTIIGPIIEYSILLATILQKIKLKDLHWKNVFTSRHIWSVNIAGFLYAAGFGAQSRISIYLDDVMKLSISEVSSKHKNLFLSIAEAYNLDG